MQGSTNDCLRLGFSKYIHFSSPQKTKHDYYYEIADDGLIIISWQMSNSLKQMNEVFIVIQYAKYGHLWAYNGFKLMHKAEYTTEYKIIQIILLTQLTQYITCNIMRTPQIRQNLSPFHLLSVAITPPVAVCNDIQIENSTSIAASNVMLVYPFFVCVHSVWR